MSFSVSTALRGLRRWGPLSGWGRLARWMLALGLLWLALVLLGWGVAPPLARTLLVSQLGQALGREVSIERLAINPLQGSVQIDGFSVKARGAGEQLGFAQLYLNLSTRSLVQGSLVVEELRLQSPRLFLTRLGEGHYDISDLLDRWLTSDNAQPAGLPRFSLSKLQISDGQLHFDDRPKGTRHTVEAIGLNLPFISSQPHKADDFVHPSLSGTVDGARFRLQGQTKPFDKTLSSEFQLVLEGLDLAQLQPYLPRGLPLRLESGVLDAQVSLVFAQPPGGAAALKVQGQSRLRGLSLGDASVNKPEAPPWLKLDQLDLALDPSEPLQGLYALASLEVQGLQGGAATLDAPLSVRGLSVRQARIDAPARSLQVQDLTVQRLDAHMSRSPQGQMVWLTLPALPAPPSPAAGSVSAPAPPSTLANPSPAPGWKAQVENIALDGVRLRLLDQTLAPPQVHALDDGLLRVRQFSTEAGHRNTFSLSAKVPRGGSVQAAGQVQLQPLALSARLQTQALPLLQAQAYLAPFLNVDVVQGQWSSSGELVLKQAPERWQVGYKGSVTLGQVALMERAERSDLLSWKSLHLAGIDFALTPARVHIGAVSLTDFDSRLILDKQGRLNVSDIVRHADDQQSAPTEKARALQVPATPPSRTASGPPWPVQIGKVTLQNGRVHFSDRFIEPSYSAHIDKLGGSIQNLSSTPGTQAELDLRGLYAGHAPVLIMAQLNPLAQQKSLDLRAEVTSIDLVDFSPYSGKYAGYKIDKGKLSLNARYRLKDRQLSADNRLFIDQLTFGEKVDSPDATQLPVHLAIALLKNKRGEIDINLPISGSLDDPQFSIGGLIFKVIGNVFVKILTSPFALLGSLFGDQQELSHIHFEPGQSRLEPAVIQTLEVLAKALREREGLKLEISAGADTQMDSEGLRRAALQRAVQAEKRQEQARQGLTSAVAGPVEIEPGQYPIYLRRAYSQANFPKPRNALGQLLEVPIEEMEKLMLASHTVSSEDLQTLASARAQAALAWLVEQGQIPASRVFLLSNQIGAEPAKGGQLGRNRVDFSLR